MQINAAPDETRRAREHPTKQINERQRIAFLDRKIARLHVHLNKAKRPHDMSKFKRRIQRAEREREDLKLYLL